MNTEYTRDLSVDTRKDKDWYPERHDAYHESVLGGIGIDTDSGVIATLGLIVRLPNGSLGALTCNHVCGYSDDPDDPSKKINQVQTQGSQRLGVLIQLGKNPSIFGGLQGMRKEYFIPVKLKCQLPFINTQINPLVIYGNKIINKDLFTQLGVGKTFSLLSYDGNDYFLLGNGPIYKNYNAFNILGDLNINTNFQNTINLSLTRSSRLICQEENYGGSLIKAHLSDSALIKIDPVRNPMDYIRGLGEGPFEFYSGTIQSLIDKEVLVSEKDETYLIEGKIIKNLSIVTATSYYQDSVLMHNCLQIRVSTSGGGNSGGIVVLKSNPKIVVGLSFAGIAGRSLYIVPIQNLVKTMNFSPWDGNIVVSKRNDEKIVMNMMSFKKVRTTTKPITHIIKDRIIECVYMEQFSDITGQPYRVRQTCYRIIIWCGAKFKIINGKKVWKINSSPTYICRVAKRSNEINYKKLDSWPHNIPEEEPITDLHSNAEMSVGGKPNIYFEKKFDNNTKNSFEKIGESIPDKFENLPITFYASHSVSKFVKYNGYMHPSGYWVSTPKTIGPTASIKTSLCWTANYDELINGYDMCNYVRTPEQDN
jgi:hypothetical protein